MSYQVLARKLRPATFDALVGQEHVVRALRHALDHGRLHHAYLFTGTRGVGKTTIARVLAKCLNCEQGISSRPCGTCSVCQEVAENRFIDLIEVDAASRTRVDDTRDLLENAQYLPTRGRYKVYLIDEVHMLSGASFNALLKTLEEPPSHVVFLLATTDPKKVPVTVLSRCLQFQLKNLAPERIAGYLAEVLAEEGIDCEAEALQNIALAARGSMRDALSITDQAIAFGQGSVRAADVSDMLGLAGRDAVAGLLDALAQEDAARVLAVSAELAERSVDFDDVLAELIAALHRLAVAQALAAPGEPADPRFTPEVVQLYYQIALMGYRDLGIAPDPRCGFEMTLLRMLAFAPDDPGAPGIGGSEGGSARVPERRGAAGTGSRSPAPRGGSPTAARGNVLALGNAAVRAPAQGVAVFAEPAVSLAVGPSPVQAPPADRAPVLEAVPEPVPLVESDGESSSGSLAGSPAELRSEVLAENTAENTDRNTAEKLAVTSSATLAPDAGASGAQLASAGRGPKTLPAGPAQDWFALVTSLGLSGVARMIGEHSELIGIEQDLYRLRLDNAHDTLLADGPVGTLERAIGERLGHPVRVRVEVGVPAGETPAVRLARERAERQHAAEATLAMDSTVQQLLSEFDGQIDGVSPIE